MLHLSFKTDSNVDTRVFYQCPKCHVQSVYFLIPPTECEYCGYQFPDIEKIGKNKSARCTYYSFGTF